MRPTHHKLVNLNTARNGDCYRTAGGDVVRYNCMFGTDRYSLTYVELAATTILNNSFVVVGGVEGRGTTKVTSFTPNHTHRSCSKP